MNWELLSLQGRVKGVKRESGESEIWIKTWKTTEYILEGKGHCSHWKDRWPSMGRWEQHEAGFMSSVGKGGISESHSGMSDSLQPPWSVKSMEFSRPEYRSAQPFPSPGDLPNPGIKTRSPTVQADSLPAEPPGKPKNTGVGSLCLLQWIFPTWESNQGLLHCRWILYQLSYQGRPKARANSTHSTRAQNFLPAHVYRVVSFEDFLLF